VEWLFQPPNPFGGLGPVLESAVKISANKESTMYTDLIDAKYYEQRLQSSLDMATSALDSGAVLAHRRFAACYRAKLASLLRVQPAPPRAVLSLAAFRDKRPEAPFRTSEPGFLIAVPPPGVPLLGAC
jgi:hypothetical protein